MLHSTTDGNDHFQVLTCIYRICGTASRSRKQITELGRPVLRTSRAQVLSFMMMLFEEFRIAYLIKNKAAIHDLDIASIVTQKQFKIVASIT